MYCALAGCWFITSDGNLLLHSSNFAEADLCVVLQMPWLWDPYNVAPAQHSRLIRKVLDAALEARHFDRMQ